MIGNSMRAFSRVSAGAAIRRAGRIHHNALAQGAARRPVLLSFPPQVRFKSSEPALDMDTQIITPASDPDYSLFTEAFLKQVSQVPSATDPKKSSEALRDLVRSKLLKFTDMKDDPEKFFLAHRLLSTVGLGGFGIRFTVQFNLFAGSMVGLAGPEQLEMLDSIQNEGKLGCFLLTENQAGVLSGLIVETTATYDSKTKEFVLHTPTDSAAKNWISQGYTAELGVVIADLIVDGKSHGPHPFFMHLRNEDGSLCDGIRIADMGIKTVANDLDNARVWFDQVRLPKNSLLNKFADIDDNDNYVQTTDEKMRIEVIGQRLLTGRQAIAEAALLSCRVLHMKTEEYAQTKKCNGIDGEKMLATMPQLRSVLDESYRQLDEMIGFVAAVEKRLNDCLRNGTIPSEDLVEQISVCKIRAISVALERAHALRMEVGSYALTWGSGFELFDMLLCCKFAEGDSRVLQMKIMRDRLKQVKKDGPVATAFEALNPLNPDSNEAWKALSLARKLNVGRDLQKMQVAMDENWKEVYELSEIIEERNIRNLKGESFVEGHIQERLAPASFEYDMKWAEKL